MRWADGELRRRAHVPLARALVGAFWRPLAVAAAHKALADLLRYLPPLLLSLLLEDLRQPADEGDVPRMLALALALPLCTLAQAVLVNQYFWRVLQLGVLVRSALAAGVCRRALRYRLCERVDGGRLSNMIASDCARVNTAIGSVCMLWSAPLQLGIALALLWRALGPATLGGLGIMVALVPLQLLISRALTRLRARTSAATDARLRRAEAALRASRAVKLHGWEELCADDVLDARRAELRLLRLESLVKSLNMMLVTIAPTLVSLCTFTALALSGGALHASTVFSSIALFNALRAPLSALPDLFASLAHARVALSRLQAVLRAAEEADGEEEDVDGEGGAPYEPPTVPGADVLRASGAIFSWARRRRRRRRHHGAAARATRRRAGAAAYRALPADAEPVCWTGIDARSGESVGDAPSEPAESAAAVEAEVRLGGVSVGVRRGELLVIVGATASGKSTLCCGLLGELHERGDLDGFELERPRRVAYCGQHAWLRRSSLRQNIVFGLPFDQSRYDAALAACGLLADVRSLPLGDAAELGERGVTISGGQQARVALARAVYAKPQLALLDEPLAALDPALREYVWHHALRGALSDAAVVLSTSDPQLALLADKVLVLHAGRAVQCAAPAALAATPGAFADLIADSLADAPLYTGMSPAVRPAASPLVPARNFSLPASLAATSRGAAATPTPPPPRRARATRSQAVRARAIGSPPSRASERARRC